MEGGSVDLKMDGVVYVKVILVPKRRLTKLPTWKWLSEKLSEESATKILEEDL